ncbi:MAG: hypothetical protein ACRCXZ_08790 [Patescibacteria group bacterium]
MKLLNLAVLTTAIIGIVGMFYPATGTVFYTVHVGATNFALAYLICDTTNKLVKSSK